MLAKNHETHPLPVLHPPDMSSTGSAVWIAACPGYRFNSTRRFIRQTASCG